MTSLSPKVEASHLGCCARVSDARSDAAQAALRYIGRSAEYQDVWDWAMRTRSTVPVHVIFADLKALRAGGA